MPSSSWRLIRQTPARPSGARAARCRGLDRGRLARLRQRRAERPRPVFRRRRNEAHARPLRASRGRRRAGAGPGAADRSPGSVGRRPPRRGDQRRSSAGGRGARLRDRVGRAPRAELRAAVEAAGALADRLEAIAPERTSEIAHAIAELALSVAKRIIQHEVRIEPSLLCGALEAAVSTINGSPEAHVLLNPAAVEPVAQAWEALHGRAYLGKKWIFEGDPTLPIGGCTLRYEHGFVEAGPRGPARGDRHRPRPGHPQPGPRHASKRRSHERLALGRRRTRCCSAPAAAATSCSTAPATRRLAAAAPPHRGRRGRAAVPGHRRSRPRRRHDRRGGRPDPAARLDLLDRPGARGHGQRRGRRLQRRPDHARAVRRPVRRPARVGRPAARAAVPRPDRPGRARPRARRLRPAARRPGSAARRVPGRHRRGAASARPGPHLDARSRPASARSTACCPPARASASASSPDRAWASPRSWR